MFDISCRQRGQSGLKKRSAARFPLSPRIETVRESRDLSVNAGTRSPGRSWCAPPTLFRKITVTIGMYRSKTSPIAAKNRFSGALELSCTSDGVRRDETKAVDPYYGGGWSEAQKDFGAESRAAI